MLRTSFTKAIASFCAICCLSAPEGLLAGSSLLLDARPFAERFLHELDAGKTSVAYEMINPAVRAKLPIRGLSRLGEVRGYQGEVRRSFVRVKPLVSIRSSRISSFAVAQSVVVCFVENPTVNFKSVSYTAVTVSKGGSPPKMQIDNFQTTSEPYASCK